MTGTTEAPPQVCDGKEQYAFEDWARGQGFDMHEHPLHYLFMDPKTDAARQAWKAALQYVNKRFKEQKFIVDENGNTGWICK